jgi:hypothetical protein
MGRFRLEIDPERRALVVAGAWDDPRGLAVAEVLEAPARELVLRPVLPAHVQGRVLLGEEQPAACKAHLILESGVASRLAATLTGSEHDTSCDRSGAFRLGPFLPDAFGVQVFPDGGLPLRLTRGAPEAKSTVDLGTLRAEGGATVRVVVADERGDPVAKAEVRATGRETLVLGRELS